MANRLRVTTPKAHKNPRGVRGPQYRWNKTNIWTELLEKRDDAVERGVVAIYKRQTSDEQRMQETKYNNKVGFTGADAEFGSSLAQQLLRGYHLTAKQMLYARRMMKRYAGQLAKIANKQIANPRYVSLQDFEDYKSESPLLLSQRNDLAKYATAVRNREKLLGRHLTDRELMELETRRVNPRLLTHVCRECGGRYSLNRMLTHLQKIHHYSLPNAQLEVQSMGRWSTTQKPHRHQDNPASRTTQCPNCGANFSGATGQLLFCPKCYKPWPGVTQAELQSAYGTQYGNEIWSGKATSATHAKNPPGVAAAGTHDQSMKSLYLSFHQNPPAQVHRLHIESPEKAIAIGRLTRIDYEPFGSSGHIGSIFTHKVGDVGNKVLPSNQILATDGKNFLLIKDDLKKKYPVFSSRGILG